MELGGEPQGEKEEKATSEPKSPASASQETSSDPAPENSQKNDFSASPTPPKDQQDIPKQVAAKQDSPKKDSKPTPTGPEVSPAAKPAPPSASESKSAASGVPFGNRDERRVAHQRCRMYCFN